jgi:uncharacterized protein YdaL
MQFRPLRAWLFFVGLFFFLPALACASQNIAQILKELGQGPSVLVLYDGPDTPANPGRLDALYLTNLLGHFTTRRLVHPLETYRTGEGEKYNAIFCIVYQKHYRVPAAFLRDTPSFHRTFCWLGNQGWQLESQGLLSRHGIRFTRFSDSTKMDRVFYKSRVVTKGDIDTNFFKIIDPSKAQALAWAGDPAHNRTPYIIHSDNLWLVADSPFSYASENDRYLVFADLLHDILGVNHPEDHRAMIRIEDINALSDLRQLSTTLNVLDKEHVPFSFGFVPAYINPHERIELRLSDRPAVVNMLKKYVAHGGTPVLHGFTHQYRGVTTDDYEFWDDLGDRPVRGDSEAFVSRRLEEAIRESMSDGIYPVTWETPHYAASALDYRVMRRFFSTVFERRLVANSLGSDQFFPYPVVDIYGQYIIPETMAYVPIENPEIGPLLDNADAEHLVRDGYASAFFHPFMNPMLLQKLIEGIKARGFHFVDLKTFPNTVDATGRIIATSDGPVKIDGRGRYVVELIISSSGLESREHIFDVPFDTPVTRNLSLRPQEVYVAYRQDFRPPNTFQKLVRLAKGDFSIFQHRIGRALTGHSLHEPVHTAIVWNPRAWGTEKLDQNGFLETLEGLGFEVERIDNRNPLEQGIGPVNLLVVPWSSAKHLKKDEVDRIMGAVQRGLTVITDGESPLSKALGISLSAVTEAVEHPQNELFISEDQRWPDRPKVLWIEDAPPDAVTYISDRESQHRLAIGGPLGVGQYLYFAPLFDPIDGKGYARFPTLPHLLVSELHLNPLLKRRAAEVYFDPGYRQNISVETLGRMWRQAGIRAVHVAAWHFYDKYSYDYARLIKVAHQNGILVYAWFEWPHVSQRFWDRHPAWREKTGFLTDAHVDWRYNMNLQDPQCLKAILSDTRDFILRYDWDGVNISELMFNSSAGPERPEYMTPFNNQARKEFQKLNGFDPLDLVKTDSPHYWRTDNDGLNRFYGYRREVLNNLINDFLSFFRDLNKKKTKSLEIIVTMLDPSKHPELTNYLGIDMTSAINLINRNDATLQVEDPASEWSKSPERYISLGQRYHQFHIDKPFMIDINVLPVHPTSQRGFATAQPTGTELIALWRAASSQSPRVCFYSEASINEQDWEIMPYAMASKASVRKDGDNWIVSSPSTVQLELGKGTRKYTLDGEPWYCDEKGDVLIPPGEHTLNATFERRRSWFDTSALQTRLLSITGELLGADQKPRGMEIEYNSATRCALTFDKAPYSTFVDNKASSLPVIRGDDGFVVLAPAGQHRLRVISQSAFLYLVEFTSVVSASLIVLFGVASTGLLFILFLFIVVRRNLRKWGKALRIPGLA